MVDSIAFWRGGGKFSRVFWRCGSGGACTISLDSFGLAGYGGRGSLHGLCMSGDDRFATGVLTIFL